MRREIALALLLTLPATAQPILGFKDSSAQHELEKRFDAQLRRENLREWMKRMTARPHHVGSPYGKENAEFIASLFRSWGYETTIERFDVLFPTPKVRVVELLAPQRYTAKLLEPALAEDATSNQGEILPPYNAYSIDGDATGELVYLNQGVPRDYEVLGRTASTCAARSSSRATAARGAASGRRSPPSAARSAASSTPIRATTAISVEPIPRQPESRPSSRLPRFTA